MNDQDKEVLAAAESADMPIAIVVKDTESEQWVMPLPENWKANARFIALANPEYVMALIQAKEKLERTSAARLKALKHYFRKCKKLKSENFDHQYYQDQINFHVAEKKQYIERLAAIEEACNTVIELNRRHAKDQCGDADKAESWSCVLLLRSALRKACDE